MTVFYKKAPKGFPGACCPREKFKCAISFLTVAQLIGQK